MSGFRFEVETPLRCFGRGVFFVCLLSLMVMLDAKTAPKMRHRRHALPECGSPTPIQRNNVV